MQSLLLPSIHRIPSAEIPSLRSRSTGILFVKICSFKILSFFKIPLRWIRFPRILSPPNQKVEG